jgi:cbb3-type cytochrome oxidase subunit 3
MRKWVVVLLTLFSAAIWLYVVWEIRRVEVISQATLRIPLDRQEAVLLTQYCATHNDCVPRGLLHSDPMPAEVDSDLQSSSD